MSTGGGGGFTATLRSDEGDGAATVGGDGAEVSGEERFSGRGAGGGATSNDAGRSPIDVPRRLRPCEEPPTRTVAYLDASAASPSPPPFSSRRCLCLCRCLCSVSVAPEPPDRYDPSSAAGGGDGECDCGCN